MQELGRVQALSLRGPRQAEVIATDEPIPGAGEVTVLVRACGVCGSDLNAWRGVAGIAYPLEPGAPGHETWGEVAAVGQGVDGFENGQLVTGLVWNGFAELAVARAENLLPVPRQFGTTPVLGEPLACAMNVVRRSGIGKGDRLAIVGFGYLAALIVQLLPAGIGGWVAISRREDSRRLALALGAEAAHDFSDVPTALWDSFAVTIEAAGVQQTLDYATWLTSYGGRLVIAGYHADGPRTVNMQSWNWKGIDVINAHERQPAVYVRGLREAFERLGERQGGVTSLITHRWPLANAAEAFVTAEARPPGFFKGLVMVQA
jgi:D-arabinose 1-dehydrogenase-like Zn-dependent alcohol dehydrogenase